MNILFVGDIHNQLDHLEKTIYHANAHVVQLGDICLDHTNKSLTESFKSIHGWSFIRGNHDCPIQSKSHNHYLGDFGFDQHLGIFYVSGASTPHKARNNTWNEKEQLSINQLDEALDFYRHTKPNVVVTHDAPYAVKYQLFSKEKDKTSMMLNTMLEYHQPKLWIFGHYHTDIEFKNGQTRFVCVNQLGSKLLNT